MEIPLYGGLFMQKLSHMYCSLQSDTAKGKPTIITPGSAITTNANNSSYEPELEAKLDAKYI